MSRSAALIDHDGIGDEDLLKSSRTPAADERSDVPGEDAELTEVFIRPTSGWRALDLGELWRYRDLVYFLTMREVSVRYKQTILGAAWAVLHPVMTAGIFTVLFAMLLGRGNKSLAIPGVPYFVSTLAVMLPWQLFAGALGNSGQSLVRHQRLVTKVYFPRLVAPLSACLAGLADFSVASTVVAGAMIYFRIPVTINVVWLPALVLLALVASLAAGLWFSALNAMYRDVQYILPFIVQVGLFVTPVLYSMEKVQSYLPGWALQLYCLNPMVGVIEGIRWALFDLGPFPLTPLLWSLFTTSGLLVSGALYFRRMERTFADVV